MTVPRFIDIHVIQTVPPSNINRDDAGSPKQAIYGGVRRARVSSQAWKRAARTYSAERQTVEQHSTRTKRIVGMLAPRVAVLTGLSADDAVAITAKAVAAVETKSASDSDTKVLLFFGKNRLDSTAQLVADHVDELAASKSTPDKPDKALKDLSANILSVGLGAGAGHGHSSDVALYGRMVADLASLNVDAATQVAHAISTHAVELEFDYFTAVDDENSDEETGAGMIGTVEFNSSTLYRYATLCVEQLCENLGGDDDAVPSVAVNFLDAFAKSMPSGHLNSFGHRTRPALVLVIGRTDQPVNLVGAFEGPVVATQGSGFEKASIETLARHLAGQAALWGDEPALVAAAYAVDGLDEPLLTAAFGAPVAFDELTGRVAAALGDTVTS